MVKETLTAKVSPKTMNRLEEYAEREGISKSEGTDRLLKQGLDVEESDMRLVPVKSDGGTIIEDELEYTQNQVNELSKEIDEVIDFLNQVGPALALAFAWFLIDAVIGLSDLASLVSGLAIIALLIIQYLRWAR